MKEKIRNLFYMLKVFLRKYSIHIILIFAFILRYRGLDYGLPYVYRTDELYMVQIIMRMLVTGDLNPHSFIWPGSFIMYLLLILYSGFFIFGLNFQDLDDFAQFVENDPTLIYFSGRLLMVIFAVITLYLVYLISKQLFNEPIAILAAFGLAISPLHISYSGFIRPDITATMLIMFSVYFLFKHFNQNKNRKLVILSSLFAGFSIATKYTSGIIVFPILIYCLINDSKQNKLLTTKYFINSFKIKTNLSRALLFTFIGFFVFAPFVVIDQPASINDIGWIVLTGDYLGHERLPGLQNHIWYLTNALQEGMGGYFFEIFAGLGLLFLLTFKRSYKNYLFLIFPILYFLVVGGMNGIWSRGFIPILPFEAIFFGIGFYYSYRYFIKKIFQGIKSNIFLLPTTGIIFLIFAAMLVFASVPTIMQDITQGTDLSRPSIKTIAKDWVEKNLPYGSKIAYERNTVKLHINPREDFILMNFWFGVIVSKPQSYYKNQSVDYIIIRSSIKQKYYNEPNKYAKEIHRYEELKNKTELIKIVEHPENPRSAIEIYKLD